MTTHMLVPPARRKAAALFAFASLLVLAYGCTGNPEIPVTPGYCPFPPNVADEDKNTMKKFSGEVTGIVKAVAGVSAAGEIQGALEKYYPAAHDVNRIYALSYAACVACRLDPSDVNGCAQRFDTIINANHAKREESVRTADTYRKQVVGPLEGTPTGK